ncbi:phosphoribosylanthranilate isomerase [Pollutimonas harenae]|uniref:N-(5'-phosphoribosyl)anthranilate isomerase n=1 Tax=Pollutimonas harenae TaxID=657015 RepID=A0A853H1H4_9BURK|nr:phosphoribosylanthranilate isomerase [Pollutimonas harenae]NYT85880.1 phosphoribosylanthranilate isomerase [Pollutimonas harenae]TEA70936.1 phosphoribosylanthranilate isomerase [Pollutimonas harenae]
MSSQLSTLQRTRIKICGLTRPQDVDTAVRAGADAVGLVFYGPSKRAVGLGQAASLRQRVPAFVDVVALFVNASTHEVEQVIEQVQPDLLQFHGDESPEFCTSFKQRYMRAFRVGGPGLDTPEAVLAACRRYPSASAWLFDSYSTGYGGSGLSFDPELLSAVRQAPDSRSIVLAGGLKADTVAHSLKMVQPYAVDVSSGVEDAPGIKSEQKIAAFVQSVASASMHR